MTKKVTWVIFTLCSIEALTGAIYTLLIPVDPKNSVFLGYSLPRLGVVALLLLAFIVTGLGAWMTRKRQWFGNVVKSLEGSGIAFAVFVVCLLVFAGGLVVNFWDKSDLLGTTAYSYFIRLQPLLIWLMLVSLQGALGLLFLAWHSYTPQDNAVFPKFARGFWSLISLCGRLLAATFGSSQPLDLNSRWFFLSVWFFVPLCIIVIYKLSAAVPIVYALTLLLYYPLVGFLCRALRPRVILILISVICLFILAARLSPTTNNINGQDTAIFKLFNVKGGEAIEQDFFLTREDGRLKSLLDDPDIYAVLRLLGNFDVDKTRLFIDGEEIGTLSSLLIEEPQGPFLGNPACNYLLKIPKKFLQDTDVVTIRLVSDQGFQASYSSGIHPLPVTPHSRLIRADGSMEDLSDRFYHRRFRFQNGIYLVSEKYFTSQGSPLVFGTIL